ncbi:M1 family metallopeptidase [Alkaliphilus serpentinus]|uniref:M1 family metallopeptidase n=1 Tax=Alkaliphilus serpentinus TaxID=1482731 RepID=A0A833HQR4_9FIRM|nr:M1 family metallopeptidase [Alkaliphilus serpentinus]KAB3532186.1 M1 family metallopeptidase [Alkaliphilus serpentinus]
MKLKRKLFSMGIVISTLLFSIIFHSIFLGPSDEGVFNTAFNNSLPVSYDISISLDDEEMILKGSQKVVISSNIEKDLPHIYFHLYCNTFKNKATAPFEKDEINRAYPNGFDSGWIKILDVRENKRSIDYKIMGETENLLRATFSKPIRNGEETEINIDFIIKIPNAIGRFGYGEDTINITNWYPILSVYDNRGWNLDPYYPIGDPFYSDIANYNLEIEIPKEYTLVTTGDILSKKSKRNKNFYNVKANNVRDFAIILSKNFSIKEVARDDTMVKSFTINGSKEKEAIEISAEALSIFNRLFGKYPYNQLSVVATDFFLGGMEYPNLVMISKDLYKMEENFPLEYVIAHEIAHQWWYGIVGNNEVREPWLDEALTEYSTLLYFEERYGDHIKEQIYEKIVEVQYESYIMLKPDRGEGILRSLREFESNLEYSSIVYSRGAMFIEALRKEMGDEGFFDGLKEYYNTYKFKNVTTLDFYRIMQNNSKHNLKDLFEEWLEISFE